MRLIKDFKEIRRQIIKEEDIKIVKEIIENVKNYGDKALKNYSKIFDKVELDNIRVSKEEIESAYNNVNETQIEALKEMIKRVKTVEEKTLSKLDRDINIEINGINIKRTLTPIENIGCYIPGGKARYPSTLIMCAVPAKIAGSKRVIVTTPAIIDPLTLVAADLCNIEEVYKVGGAQAIAAMAYGTESIKAVDKIVGPGGIFVTIAKYLVSNKVSMDMLAGPTELVIIADKYANPKFIAYDLIAQAEHSRDTLCGLITDNDDVINNVIKEIESLLFNIERNDIIKSSLNSNGFIVKCNDIEEAIDLANNIAPEHLEIITNNAKDLAKNIRSAGLILINEYSSSLASDYMFGTNHVLPTLGFAKSRGSLSVLDFLKLSTIAECNKEALKEIINYITVIAESEGLPNHAKAVSVRI
jgi:histidinol dehydrogenase